MKIAIVGAGIVGSTAAYYLSKEKDAEVTVFDHGLYANGFAHFHKRYVT